MIPPKAFVFVETRIDVLPFKNQAMWKCAVKILSTSLLEMLGMEHACYQSWGNLSYIILLIFK